MMSVHTKPLGHMARHRYSPGEMAEALALPENDVKAAQQRLIKPDDALRGKLG